MELLDCPPPLMHGSSVDRKDFGRQLSSINFDFDPHAKLDINEGDGSFSTSFLNYNISAGTYLKRGKFLSESCLDQDILFHLTDDVVALSVKSDELSCEPGIFLFNEKYGNKKKEEKDRALMLKHSLSGLSVDNKDELSFSIPSLASEIREKISFMNINYNCIQYAKWDPSLVASIFEGESDEDYHERIKNIKNPVEISKVIANMPPSLSQALSSSDLTFEGVVFFVSYYERANDEKKRLIEDLFDSKREGELNNSIINSFTVCESGWELGDSILEITKEHPDVAKILNSLNILSLLKPQAFPYRDNQEVLGEAKLDLLREGSSFYRVDEKRLICSTISMRQKNLLTTALAGDPIDWSLFEPRKILFGATFKGGTEKISREIFEKVKYSSLDFYFNSSGSLIGHGGAPSCRDIDTLQDYFNLMEGLRDVFQEVLQDSSSLQCIEPDEAELSCSKDVMAEWSKVRLSDNIRNLGATIKIENGRSDFILNDSPEAMQIESSYRYPKIFSVHDYNRLVAWIYESYDEADFAYRDFLIRQIPRDLCDPECQWTFLRDKEGLLGTYKIRPAYDDDNKILGKYYGGTYYVAPEFRKYYTIGSTIRDISRSNIPDLKILIATSSLSNPRLESTLATGAVGVGIVRERDDVGETGDLILLQWGGVDVDTVHLPTDLYCSTHSQDRNSFSDLLKNKFDEGYVLSCISYNKNDDGEPDLKQSHVILKKKKY